MVDAEGCDGRKGEEPLEEVVVRTGQRSPIHVFEGDGSQVRERRPRDEKR